ncbi:hypothetical protein [Photobacterium damselae]
MHFIQQGKAVESMYDIELTTVDIVNGGFFCVLGDIIWINSKQLLAPLC